MPDGPESNLKTIWNSVKSQYKELGTKTQFSDLRTSMFSNKSKSGVPKRRVKFILLDALDPRPADQQTPTSIARA